MRDSVMHGIFNQRLQYQRWHKCIAHLLFVVLATASLLGQNLYDRLRKLMGRRGIRLDN